MTRFFSQQSAPGDYSIIRSETDPPENIPGSKRVYPEPGGLVVYDEEDQIIAVFAPGAWIAAIKTVSKVSRVMDEQQVRPYIRAFKAVRAGKYILLIIALGLAWYWFGWQMAILVLLIVWHLAIQPQHLLDSLYYDMAKKQGDTQ